MSQTQIRKVTPDDKRLSDALSINAGLAVTQAIRLLARAAACEERLDDGSHSEGQLYFIVRALCAEHGIDYEGAVAFGRDYADLL